MSVDEVVSGGRVRRDLWSVRVQKRLDDLAVCADDADTRGDALATGREVERVDGSAERGPQLEVGLLDVEHSGIWEGALVQSSCHQSSDGSRRRRFATAAQAARADPFLVRSTGGPARYEPRSQKPTAARTRMKRTRRSQRRRGRAMTWDIVLGDGEIGQGPSSSVSGGCPGASVRSLFVTGGRARGPPRILEATCPASCHRRSPDERTVGTAVRSSEGEPGTPNAPRDRCRGLEETPSPGGR